MVPVLQILFRAIDDTIWRNREPCYFINEQFEWRASHVRDRVLHPGRKKTSNVGSSSERSATEQSLRQDTPS